MQNNALAPIYYGDELTREAYLGSSVIQNWLPTETHPYHERIQENQERDGKTSTRIPQGCTIFQYLDISENKVHNELGEWHQVKKGEFDRLMRMVVEQGYGSYIGGCHMNGINKVMEDGETIQMGIFENGKWKDTIKIQQERWYIVADRSMTSEEFEAAVRYELAWNPGGVQYGMVTKQSRMGYLEADNLPYIVHQNQNPIPIAHAFPLTSYNDNEKQGLIYSPGSGGETFGDEGTVYFNGSDLRKGFTPIGFNIKILNN